MPMMSESQYLSVITGDFQRVIGAPYSHEIRQFVDEQIQDTILIPDLFNIFFYRDIQLLDAAI